MEEYHIDRFWNSVMNSKELFVTNSETNAKERGFDNFFIVESEHGLTIRDSVHLKHRIREGEVNVVVIDDGVDLDDVDRNMLSDVGAKPFFIESGEYIDEHELDAFHYVNSVTTGVVDSPFVDSHLRGVFGSEIDRDSNIINCLVSLTDDVFNEAYSVNGLVIIANANLDDFIKENGQFLDPATTPYIVIYNEGTGFNLYDIVTKEIHLSGERLETVMRTLGFIARKDARKSEVTENIEGFKKYIEDFKSKKTLLIYDDSEGDHSRVIDDLNCKDSCSIISYASVNNLRYAISLYKNPDLIIITKELYDGLGSDVKDYLFALSEDCEIYLVTVENDYDTTLMRYRFEKMGNPDDDFSDDFIHSVLSRGKGVFVDHTIPEHITPESNILDNYFLNTDSSANGIVIVPSIKAGGYSNICKEEVPYFVVYCEPELGIYNRSTKKAYFNSTITNMLAELNLYDKVAGLESVVEFDADSIDLVSHAELSEVISKHNENYDKLIYNHNKLMYRPTVESTNLLEVLSASRKITSTSKIDTKRKRYKLKIYT